MKQIPNDLTLEKSLLCALISEYTDVTDILDMTDFYRDEHGKIYNIINKLREMADMQTVRAGMVEAGISEPEIKIVDIMQISGSPASAKSYAVALKRYSVRRQIIFRCQHLQSQAYDLTEPLEALQGIEIQAPRVSGLTGGIISLTDIDAEIFAFRKNGYKKTVGFGWPTFDEYYKTMPGLLNIWTGSPSSGKSEFLDARNANMCIIHGWKFAYFSPENYPTEMHASKLFEKFKNKSFFSTYAFPDGMTDLEISECIHRYNDNFKFVFPPETEFSLDHILERFKIIVEKYGVNSVILDPWNKVGHQIPSGMTEKQYISQSLDRCTGFAKRHNVEFNIVAHPVKLKKDDFGEYEVAKAYDISGAAEWFDKADGVFSVYRKYKTDLDKVEIHIQKVRHKYCGTVGMVTFKYNKLTGKYDDEIESI